ncbi:MAG TPA: DUF503 domain-containing protein [Candidatus Dormibacteraeota bacterium]|nr:DUF503 domain-containing protein [Candidatus Dormibacteraeota bacterium]
MPIGCLTLEIHLSESRSLKDKRQVMRSLKDRLRHRFNVSVAELDGQDTWQSAVVGIVAISADAGYLEKALQAALEESELILGRGLVGHDTELF